MNSRQDKGSIALCTTASFLKQYHFYETNLFTVVKFWLTQSSIISVYWFKLYPNQSWHKHILFNLFEQHWIKHNASSLSVADCEAQQHICILIGSAWKVDAGIVANLTLPTHSLTHVLLDMIVTDRQAQHRNWVMWVILRMSEQSKKHMKNKLSLHFPY